MESSHEPGSSLLSRYEFHRRNLLHDLQQWEKHLAPLVDGPVSYLEIGILEGRSGCWMLDHVLIHPKSHYTGIDNWHWGTGKVAHRNLSHHAKKVTIYDGRSLDVLRTLSGDSFDIVYIDGDHSAPMVLFDSILCWGLLRSGGFLIWDDYAQISQPGQPCNVRLAVDSFLACMPKSIYRKVWQDYQLAILKTEAVEGANQRDIRDRYT